MKILRYVLVAAALALPMQSFAQVVREPISGPFGPGSTFTGTVTACCGSSLSWANITINSVTVNGETTFGQFTIAISLLEPGVASETLTDGGWWATIIMDYNHGTAWIESEGSDDDEWSVDVGGLDIDMLELGRAVGSMLLTGNAIDLAPPSVHP